VKGKAADSWLKAQAEPEPAAELEPEPAPAADEDAPTRLLSIAGQPLEFAHARFGASRCEIRDVKAVAVDPIKADDFVQNVEQLNGNIAVAERGAITFVQKALKIQNAGAVAALFVNAGDELFTLDGDEDDQVGATPSINLPACVQNHLMRNACRRFVCFLQDVSIPITFVRGRDGSSLLTRPASGAWPAAALRYKARELCADDAADATQFEDASKKKGRMGGAALAGLFG